MCNPTKQMNRSVDDYETEEALANALQWMELSFDGTAEVKNQEVNKETPSQWWDKSNKEENKGIPACATVPLPEQSDWVLTNYDPETTKAPCVQDEFERLRVLRSYMILDVERELVFEKFTVQAMHEFHVPIALVSLVDLGRQWFLSNSGSIADVPETSRDVAFCAHAILRKEQRSILEVRDATLDPRFCNNPLVTGAPHVRFYAGAPLVSPEGASLGTFCVIDTQPRPAGLTLEQQGRLQELAGQTVQRMVDRRRKQEGRGVRPSTRRGGRRPVAGGAAAPAVECV